MKLTKSKIDALPITGREQVFRDEEIRGLSIRVGKTGTKTWRVEYRPFPGGRGAPVRRMSLGDATIITPKMARDEARIILARVANKEDPARERNRQRNEIGKSEQTVGDLLDRYIRDGRRIRRGKNLGKDQAEGTWNNKLANIENHTRPIIGHVPLSRFDRHHVEQLFSAVANGETTRDEKTCTRGRRIVRGGEGAARKVVRDLSAICNWAEDLDIIVKNPVPKASVDLIDEERTAYLTVEQAKRFMEVVDEVEAQTGNRKAADICRLFLRTGCRRNEIAGLKWSEIDLENRHLILEVTKEGRSWRPLSEEAVAILKRQVPQVGSDYVFPATRGKGFYTGFRKFLEKVRSRSGLRDAFPHMLRHSMGSIAVSNDVTLEKVGNILGHRKRASTERYAHVAKSAGVAAVDAVNDIF